MQRKGGKWESKEVKKRETVPETDPNGSREEKRGSSCRLETDQHRTGETGLRGEGSIVRKIHGERREERNGGKRGKKNRYLTVCLQLMVISVQQKLSCVGKREHKAVFSSLHCFTSPYPSLQQLAGPLLQTSAVFIPTGKRKCRKELKLKSNVRLQFSFFPPR